MKWRTGTSRLRRLWVAIKGHVSATPRALFVCKTCRTWFTMSGSPSVYIVTQFAFDHDKSHDRDLQLWNEEAEDVPRG